MAFFEQAKQLKELEEVFYDQVPEYLSTFDELLLKEPIKRLDHSYQEREFRSKLQRLFEKKLSKYNSFPEFQESWVCDGNVDYIDYSEMCIHCEEWQGDSRNCWYVPILMPEQLEALQEQAFEIVDAINLRNVTAKAVREANEKEARRNEYLKLKQEFGDE